MVENPYHLVVIPTDMAIADINLDEPGWMTTFADYMRKPGFWYLVSKQTKMAALAVCIYEGEQPYYVARHQGKAGAGGSNEITIYGIGKKLLDGSVMRLWVLPNGTVVGGNDDAPFGAAIVEALGPR